MSIKTIEECFFHIQNGANIKQGEMEGGYPITRIETTSNDKFNRDRMGYAGITDLNRYSSYVLEDGDLLMSHINSVQYLGRTVLYNKLNDSEIIIHGMNLLRLKADRSIIVPEYARYCFYSNDFRSQLSKITKKSVNQASFAVKDLKKIKIDVPEINQQLNIISKLDKVQKIVVLRKKQLEKLDELIKARFVELTECSEAKPTRMGDVATYLNGYAFKPTQWEEKGLPIIRIQNLNDPTAPYNFYSGTLADKYFVHKGDVLVSWATHLEAYIWKGQDAWLNQHIFKVVFDKMEVDKIYFVYACEEALRQAFRNAHGFKPTMEHIKKADFDAAIVKLPKIEIQKQFADFVQQVDKSKVVVQKHLKKAQLLFDSLMQEYFG